MVYGRRVQHSDLTLGDTGLEHRSRSEHVFFVAQQLHAEFDENLYFLYNIKAMDRHNINLHTQIPELAPMVNPQVTWSTSHSPPTPSIHWAISVSCRTIHSSLQKYSPTPFARNLRRSDDIRDRNNFEKIKFDASTAHVMRSTSHRLFPYLLTTSECSEQQFGHCRLDLYRLLEWRNTSRTSQRGYFTWEQDVLTVERRLLSSVSEKQDWTPTSSICHETIILLSREYL